MAGAVNLIVKEKNKLYGYNTDVYGAYQSIKDKIKYYKNNNHWSWWNRTINI